MRSPKVTGRQTCPIGVVEPSVTPEKGLVGALEGAHRVLLLAGNRDDTAASWHLEDVVAVVGHCHELGQGRIPEDGIVRQTDVSNVEVDELGVVVVMLT